ncbi:MAG: DUF4058 family protein [bacterium]|nr:DUF4058 family protein [bacterium]
MPLHFRENRYPGINAHLHSRLQHTAGGWQSFHSAHITDLTRAIIALLPAGYYALNERSLQLIEITGGSYTPRPTTADIAVYQIAPTTPGTAVAEVPTAVTPPIRTLPVADTLSDEDYFTAVIIYQRDEAGEGIPVTRIELLSPANKPPGSHYHQYLAKRDETLQSGINLVEIDYLHERRFPVRAIASYPDGEPDAHPYVVLVNDPRPTLEQGRTAIYGFHIGDPIPTIPVPLASDEQIVLELGSVYHYTFAQNPYYGMIAVDYEQLPVNFERYSPQDQERIRALMEAVGR